MNKLLEKEKNEIENSYLHLLQLKMEQKKTKDSLKRIDDNIYFLDYQNDYALDEMLKKGASNVGEVLTFASKTFTLGTRKFKAGKIGFGCTTFNARATDGSPLLARNFDYKAAPCLVVKTQPENGYKSIAVTDCNFMVYGYKNRPDDDRDRLQLLLSPYICVDGINEKGLAVGLLEIKAAATKQKTGKVPLPNTVMIRALLDKAANIDEAIELFKQFDIHDSIFVCYHYHLADASGRSVIIEYINNEMRVIEAKQPQGVEYPFNVCTNFFISPDGDNRKGTGYDRFDKCNRKLISASGTLDTNDCLKLLNYCTLKYYHQLTWPVITLWSAVYNCRNLTLDLCAGMDYKHKYTFSLSDGTLTPSEL